jgi:hypothetical protein
MSEKHHELLIYICNWIFGITGASTWWIVKNIDLINKFMEFGLKGVSLVSFIMIVIINRRKALKELKSIFNKCPE